MKLSLLLGRVTHRPLKLRERKLRLLPISFKSLLKQSPGQPQSLRKDTSTLRAIWADLLINIKPLITLQHEACHIDSPLSYIPDFIGLTYCPHLITRTMRGLELASRQNLKPVHDQISDIMSIKMTKSCHMKGFINNGSSISSFIPIMAFYL